MFVIGSQALNVGGIPANRPYAPDLDLVATEAEMRSFCAQHGLVPKQLAPYKWQVTDAPEYGRIEFELLEHSRSGQEYWRYMSERGSNNIRVMRVYGLNIPVAPLEVLLSIKRSHRHYPRAWHKHVMDYLALKRTLGSDSLEGITGLREQETKERYGALKTPSLNKNVADFFNDKVSNRVFVHDEIHQVMAHREQPMFEYIKADTEKVACSRAKFEELSYRDRLRCVLEEAYVIALERAVIPMLFDRGPLTNGEMSIKWALMRICTTLTSGWFREFALENYDNLLAAYDRGFVGKFLKAVDDGRIVRIAKADGITA